MLIDERDKRTISKSVLMALAVLSGVMCVTFKATMRSGTSESMIITKWRPMGNLYFRVLRNTAEHVQFC